MATQRARIGESNWKRRLWITFFVGPHLLGMLVFLVIPIVASLALSFAEWDLLTPLRWIGLDNYTALFSSADFWAALQHTFFFIIGYLPLVLVLGLGLALLMNRKLRGIIFFRTAFFMPVVSAWVAVALLWKWLLNPRYGLVNYLLSLVGIQGPGWMFDPNWAMPSIILASVWKDLGFVMMLLLAGLQAIPLEYEEAARIDGAGPFNLLRRVTLPLLSPTIFFVVIISLVNSFQVFQQVYVMTRGGPAGASQVLVGDIVDNAFSYSKFGYASAESWVLFALIFAVTVFQWLMQKRFVHYQ
ncbi:MAG TPA: sugar ABC transporter permease [Chloroflexia bacterium]|nr:sugar ABC transporter permease [Chloroflexia bacterium]